MEGKKNLNEQKTKGNRKTQHNLYIQKKKKGQKIHKEYWYYGKWR